MKTSGQINKEIPHWCSIQCSSSTDSADMRPPSIYPDPGDLLLQKGHYKKTLETRTPPSRLSLQHTHAYNYTNHARLLKEFSAPYLLR